MSEFTAPVGEDHNQHKYQFEGLYTNGLLGVIFSLGVLFTSLKSRRARAWRYGTGLLQHLLMVFNSIKKFNATNDEVTINECRLV